MEAALADERPKTKTYTLLSGKHWSRDKDGNEVKHLPGDSVELTENQFNAFKDKFEDPEAVAARRVSRVEAAKAAREAQAPGKPAQGVSTISRGPTTPASAPGASQA
jgi:hypothetical protein